MDEDSFGAWLQNHADLTPKQQTALDRANEIIANVKKADVLVFGVPWYNFNIPRTLKAWLDYLMCLGETFVYTKMARKDG